MTQNELFCLRSLLQRLPLFFFVSDFRQLPCRYLLEFSPFFVHCCFRIWYFHCLRHRNKFAHQVKSRKSSKRKVRRKRCGSNCENYTTVALCLARLGSIGFPKRQTVRGNPMQKVLGPIRRERFTQSTLRQASIREYKGPSLGKIQVKIPHQRSPYARNLRTDLEEKLKDKSDPPAETRGNLPKYIQTQGKGISYIPFAFQ